MTKSVVLIWYHNLEPEPVVFLEVWEFAEGKNTWFDKEFRQMDAK